MVSWSKVTRQTWCATGYMNMVYNGLLGIRFKTDGITFSPFLPVGITDLELKDIPYRQAVLDIIVKGKGNVIKSFSVNGVSQSTYKIAATTQGAVKIEIELVKETSTGIAENMKNDKFSTFTADGNLHVLGVKDSLVKVYNVSGVLVEHLQSIENEAITKLPSKGAYLVSVAGKSNTHSTIKVINN